MLTCSCADKMVVVKTQDNKRVACGTYAKLLEKEILLEGGMVCMSPTLSCLFSTPKDGWKAVKRVKKRYVLLKAMTVIKSH